ncbi:MAG TPA: hypothetical protein VHE55_02810 [Fimbriimonadaceae bacterium]|nr:hypothetical protein [Fimbriimonadaceae bacterium]
MNAILYLVFLGNPGPAPKIAFVRAHTLYVLPCDPAGKPKGGAKPVRICSVPQEAAGGDKMIEWTPSGRIVFIPMSEPHVYPPTVEVVDPTPGAKPSLLVRGYSPSFSPDGTRLAFSTTAERWGTAKVSILDLKTGKIALFADHAADPVWSPRGDRIACHLEGDDFSEEVDVREYPSGKLVRKFPPAVNPSWMSFSPNGSVLAVHYSLSRPKTGHTLFDLASGKVIDLPYPNKYAPPTIEDWSPDGQAVICDWRVIDPKNDGSWIKQFEAVTWFGTGKSQLLGEGRDGQFAPDGAHVLYISGTRGAGSLVSQPTHGGAKVRIASDVTQFAIR